MACNERTSLLSQEITCNNGSIDIIDTTAIAEGCGLFPRIRTRFFPLGFWKELKEICKLALPIVLTSIVTFMLGPVSLVFCGHLSRIDIAAAGLAISVFNVTGLAITTGLLTACDTLFAQTYGGENKFNMGIQLQRALVIISFCCLPCWALHLVIEPILFILQQNRQISIIVSTYLVYMMPGLLFAAWYQTLTKYIQAQNRVFAPMTIGILGNCCNALLHYIFLYSVNYGLMWSAIAQTLSYFFQFMALLAYFFVSRLYKTTWQGYKKEMWSDWGIWFKLAVPGLTMTGLEWWIFEFGTIAAGAVGENELVTQTIIFNVESLAYTLLPLGFGISASIRVGQGLGAGNHLRPITTMSVTLVLLWVASIFGVAFFLLLKDELPKIFTNDKTVIQMTADVFPIIALYQLFDGNVGAASGIIRGTGMQLVGAFVCFVSLYVIGEPVGLCLLFLTPLRVKGLWWGLTLGSFAEAAIYLIVCLNINWEYQVKLALERTRIRPIDTIETTAQIRELEDDFSRSEGYNNKSRHRITSGNYQSVSCDWQRSLPPSTLDVHRENGTKVGNSEYRLRNIEIVNAQRRLYVNRFSLLSSLCLIFLVCLFLRIFVPWSFYFGASCVVENGTSVHLDWPNVSLVSSFKNQYFMFPLENCLILQP